MASTIENDKIENAFQELCFDLNMDKQTIENAWSDYRRILQLYTLEGDHTHWLTCSLYIACRKAVTLTVNNEKRQGNFVSLTRLLRTAKISLIEFFKKMGKWLDMAGLSIQFRNSIERLERTFQVSAVTFNKYEAIFACIFRSPDEEESNVKRSRKQRGVNCTSFDIFSFTWTLFIYIKGNFPAISDDLVNSYHLLLCCIDFIYNNALISGRRDLFNLSFPALPPEFDTKHWTVPTKPTCTLDTLCSLYGGVIIEAKTLKEHHLKNILSNVVKNNLLKGADDGLSGFLDFSYFEFNMKSMNNEYETYLLTHGEFDERIFLGEDAHVDIGTPAKKYLFKAADSSKVASRLLVKRNLQQHFENSGSLVPHTPLTNRKYLTAKPEVTMTPISQATNIVSKLHILISGWRPEPSDQLMEVIQECDGVVALDQITANINELSTLFSSGYGTDLTSDDTQIVDKRVRIGKTLFFKVLEDICGEEKKRLKEGVSLSSLLSQQVMYKCLFACCLEIVMFSYGTTQRSFPWILDVLDIPAFHFFKIIEVVIKTEEGLSRDIVKHLNEVEERILENLAWKSNSPLWELVNQTEVDGKLPNCDDVMLPSQISSTGTPFKRNEVVNSPFNRVKGSVNDHSDLASPTSAHDRYAGSNPGSARRRLFGGNEVDQLHEQTNLIEDDSKLNDNKPKKTGSLALFMRKIYYLSSVRLRDLCIKLKLDPDVQLKSWTVLVHSLVNFSSELCRDRHMDQLVMCAVYIISKFTKSCSFQDIMKCYRWQPQAHSHIYRTVLVQRAENDHEEITGDLIQFYNKVYLKKLQPFVLKFSSNLAKQPTLSLLPHSPCRLSSPRKLVSSHHSLFVSPHKPNSPANPPTSPYSQSSQKLLYCFNKSPSLNLKDINNMVNGSDVTRKRNLTFDDDGSPRSKMPSGVLLISNGGGSSQVVTGNKTMVLSSSFLDTLHVKK